MPHFGLMITRDDDPIIAEWFRLNARYFDEIVCLDGSESDFTQRAAASVPNVHYLHESDVRIDYATDHGLRDVAHRRIVKRHGHQGWITLCHADEFFYHDPRKCCQWAEQRGCDGIAWYALHFLPHPAERERWSELADLPVHQQFRYFHWAPGAYECPWIEFRSYRNLPHMQWEPVVHGSTEPIGCARVARFHPVFRHYKVLSIDPTAYVSGDGRATHACHWSGVDTGRTGLLFEISRPEDLFVLSYSNYRCCDYFDGALNHDWNMGEQFR